METKTTPITAAALRAMSDRELTHAALLVWVCGHPAVVANTHNMLQKRYQYAINVRDFGEHVDAIKREAAAMLEKLIANRRAK